MDDDLSKMVEEMNARFEGLSAQESWDYYRWRTLQSLATNRRLRSYKLDEAMREYAETTRRTFQKRLAELREARKAGRKYKPSPGPN